MANDKQPVQIRTRKFIRNPLLSRRQFVRQHFITRYQLSFPNLNVNFHQIIDVIHPGRANVSKKELQEKVGAVMRYR